MALNIKSEIADNLARKLAKVRGESITDAVIASLRESLEREAIRPHAQTLAQSLREISLRCAALPDLDTRTPEQILGFDTYGLPS